MALGALEQVLQDVREPVRRRLGAGRVGEMLDHHHAVDLPPLKGVQEGLVIVERHASIRLAAGAEHVGVRQDPVAAIHLAVADRRQADGAHAVENLLAHRELVDIRRRRPERPQVHRANVVHVRAEARMRFQPAPAGQVHRLCGDVVDRGVAVIFLGRRGRIPRRYFEAGDTLLSDHARGCRRRGSRGDLWRGSAQRRPDDGLRPRIGRRRQQHAVHDVAHHLARGAGEREAATTATATSTAARGGKTVVEGIG